MQYRQFQFYRICLGSSGEWCGTTANVTGNLFAIKTSNNTPGALYLMSYTKRINHQ